MTTNSRTGQIGILAIAAAAGAVGLALGGLFTPGSGAVAQDAGIGGSAMTGPRYTVIDTEGWNLLVTDNRTDTLHFYTVDEGAEVGSELKLRGSIDLSQVGQPTLTPRKSDQAGRGRRE